MPSGQHSVYSSASQPVFDPDPTRGVRKRYSPSSGSAARIPPFSWADVVVSQVSSVGKRADYPIAADATIVGCVAVIGTNPTAATITFVIRKNGTIVATHSVSAVGITTFVESIPVFAGNLVRVDISNDGAGDTEDMTVVLILGAVIPVSASVTPALAIHATVVIPAPIIFPLLPIALPAVVAVHPIIPAPTINIAVPTNDNFANATIIDVSSPGTINGTITGMTIESGETTLSGRSTQTVWYKFTPATTRSITIDTQLTATGDTTMRLYSGSSIGSLTLIGQSDDEGGGVTSLLTRTVTGGVEYHVQIASYSSPDSFNFTLRWN